MQTNSTKQLNDFWDTFIFETDHFRKSKSFDGYPANHVVTEQDIVEILQAISQYYLRGYTAGLRIYTDSVSQSKYENHVVNHPPQQGELLKDWAESLFGNVRFGMVINHAERWSDTLCNKILNFLQPFHALVGLFRYQLELVVFMGNYGFTPFGIHYDGDECANIHLHLGPGTKEMYLWSPAHYKTMTGSYDFCHEPERYLASAEKYIIQPNNIYLLPAGFYHVGRTQTFSIGMALCLVRYNNKKTMIEAIKHKLDQEYSRLPEFMLESKNQDEFIRALCSNTIASHHLPVSSFLSDVVEEKSFLINSNYGFLNPPRKSNDTIETLKGKKIKKTEFYLIHIKHLSADKMAMFVRGNRIVVKHNNMITNLIERINTGSVLSIDHIIEGLTPSLIADIESFIILLKNYGGIVIF